MQINRSKVIDWLLNGWEHDFLSADGGSYQQQVESVCDYLLEDCNDCDKESRKVVETMVEHWISNSDNDRLTISMDIENSEELIIDYVNKFLK